MTPGGRPLVLVAAVARNGVIGAAGGMPWHIPSDLARFRSLTLGHPLLMGRTTYESIGRPLPGRLTTVLTRTKGFAPTGVTVAVDLATALRSLDRQAETLEARAVMVVGGGAVYAATIGMAERLHITTVEADPAGNVLFPAIDAAIWEKVEDREIPHGPDDTYGTRDQRWERWRPEDRRMAR